jgi:hypothetical protein
MPPYRSRHAGIVNIAPILLLAVTLGCSLARPLAATTPSDSTVVASQAERRLYVGMWTMHFREMERGLDNNWVLGMSWGNVYGATFMNSFGKRAYSAGLQGSLVRWDTSPVALGLGYRAGLITGYDERFISWAGKTPVLPLVQPLVHLDGKRLGLELSYSGVIASAAFNVRF